MRQNKKCLTNKNLIVTFLYNRIKEEFYLLSNSLNQKNFVLMLIYILGSVPYILSLKPIIGNNLECYLRDGHNCFIFLGKLILFSALITDISIFFIINKKYSKFHLLIIVIIYFILYRIDHSSILKSHGFYNFIIFILLLIIIFFILLSINYLLFLFHKKKYCSIIKFIIIFSFLQIIISFIKIQYFSCNNWVKGFNNTEIDNISKDFPCIINVPSPHSCYLKIIGPYLDFTPKLKPTCSSDELLKIENNILFHNLKKLKFANESNMNHFGLPITNQNNYGDLFGTILTHDNKIDFYTYINSHIILMDLYNKNKSKYYPKKEKPEIEIIFEKGKGKVIFNISKKEKLIEKRKKLINKKNILYKNVLIFFFDTLSRVHFHRKFKKTKNFLSNFSKYEQNFRKKNFTIFEFFKYHSLVAYTAPNIKAAYYGSAFNQKRIHFGNYYRKNGYIIGRTNTYCGKEVAFNKNKKIL